MEASEYGEMMEYIGSLNDENKEYVTEIKKLKQRILELKKQTNQEQKLHVDFVIYSTVKLKLNFISIPLVNTK